VITIGFAGDKTYRFSDFFIDPAATHGDTPNADLKDFEIRASTDGQTFTTVFTGTTLQEDKLQHFHLSQPVDARELQIVALDNYGSADHVAIAEFEAYSSAAAPTGPYRANLRRTAQKLPPDIAQVRYIRRGLTVSPPHKHHTRGKVKMPLYNQYGLNTAAGEKASIAFVEGTVLHMNQLTSVLLQSPHVTTVQKGEVQEDVKPGSNHQVQTSTALASAVGTIFDVRVFKHHRAIFTVVEGALLVKNPKGTTLVKTDQQTVVQSGQAPGAPQPANVSQLTWTAALPAPNLGKNLALDANGGHIIAAP
jgi:hypothetical protein